jgi:hypothetical protein
MEKHSTEFIGLDVVDFPLFSGHVNLAPYVALEICDGQEVQFGKNTTSL